MSLVKAEDGKKWINAFVAIISIVTGYVIIRFSHLLGEWFDLEARVSHFTFVAQGLGIIVGLATFILIQKHSEAQKHLSEVYSELLKVVWPDKDSVVKITVGLVISLSIVSGFFVLVDFVFRKILNLVY